MNTDAATSVKCTIHTLKILTRKQEVLGRTKCPLYFDTMPTAQKTTKKLRGLSPRANYTDRATAACRPIFADRGCHVVSVTGPYACILGFLDRSRNFFFQVAPQLYSRGSVDSVPDPLLLRKIL
jgi:hypothetical protein